MECFKQAGFIENVEFVNHAKSVGHVQNVKSINDECIEHGTFDPEFVDRTEFV